ncbi:MAG: hypothetical protein R3B84_06150 [Zavarzinella sp.]
MLFAIAFEGFANVLIGLLAIVGGFIAGYFLGLLLTILSDRYIFNKKIPRFLRSWIRVFSGALLALIVALFVFGKGGFGFGGSGGGLLGGNDTDSGGNTASSSTATAKTTIINPATSTSPILKVTILGGDAQDGKFYVVDGLPVAQTLEQVKQQVLARNQSKNPLTRMIIYVYANSASRENPVVLDLSRFAQEMKLTVEFPPVQNQLRP